eukprot:TRINITY_DN780_c0_g1_i1.p1 TRINITY_DN780_c0_g1~~TRINITY_DN780_c0_g1_i1.p1  ORF type:complete len:561 (+),score=167.70 TRINITY_DN780_c0_g1_i1:159-1685(+)
MGRVVMIRGLPQGAADEDLVRLGSCVARVEKAMVLKMKNMGFIEFQTEEGAQTFIARAETEGIMVRHQQVQCARSTHPEISHSSALHVDDALLMRLGIITGAAVRAVPAGGAGAPALPPPARLPGSVVSVSLQNLTVPVRVDDLYHLFSQFGRVERITSERAADGARQTTLVQMGSPRDASAAVAALNGQFVGCATLAVVVTNQAEVVVRQIGPHHRDYERSGPPQRSGDSPIVFGKMQGPLAAPGMGMLLQQGAGANPLGQMQQLLQMQMAQGGAPNSGGSNSQEDGGEGSILICSGLNEQLTLNHLWELAGKVGDVQTVKIMYKNRDKCLMQFADARGAREAQAALNGLELFGTRLRVSASTQAPPIKMGLNDQGLIATRESHRKHRYNPANVAPPSDTLHVSVQSRTGAPVELPHMKDRLVPLFREHGAVTGFEQFKQKRNLCIIRMDSLTSALAAMVALNMHQLDTGGGQIATMGVGFSRHPLEASETLPDDPVATLAAMATPG